MRSLTITDVRTTVVGTPWRELVFVELVTDEGLTGVGEVRMVNRTETLLACVHELAPRHVIGTDPFDVERLAWKIQRSDYSRPGEVTQSALAAFDIACWDLKGQALGVPVWKLLGGRFRDRVPAYANGWYQAERTPEATEFVDSRHADIDSFLGLAHESGDPSEFSRLDADFVRVIEDVIDTLIVKNIINITDLPSEAQAKLFARKSFRERATKDALKLFGDDQAD